jgi:hypothetical protein
MTRLILSCLSVVLFANSLVQAQSPRTIPVGKNPESVCRGFGGKLYVTMINEEVSGMGRLFRWTATP